MPTIRLTLLNENETNATVQIKPTSFLGGTLFDTYRHACNGARFDSQTKSQVAPLVSVLPILTRLQSAGFTLDVPPNLHSLLTKSLDQKEEEQRQANERANAIDEVLKARGLFLYPFQRATAAWLAARTSALVALDMGCGKTVCALIAAPTDIPILVICPAVAKGVWKSEASKWRPDLKPAVLSGKGSFRWPSKGELVITNYEILPDLQAYRDGNKNLVLSDPPPMNMLVILDESHAVKSYKSTRTKRARIITSAARCNKGRTWLLTGTPLLNRPPELFTQLEVAGAEREVFGSWNEFVRMFGGYKDEWGGMHWASTPSAEVPGRIARAMIRYKKDDVLQDLPEATTQLVDVEIATATKRIADEALAALKSKGIDLESATDLSEEFQDAGVDIGTCSKVRQALATAKIPALLALVQEYEENETPVVVMSAHLAPIEALKGREGWACITGVESAEEKTKTVEAFQAGLLKGVACTIRSAGVGITLTKASNMVFVDRDWTPGLNDQAQDRVRRIGQKSACLYRILVANHAMDVHVTRLLTKKQKLVAATVDEVTKEQHVPKASDSERALLAAIATEQAQQAQGDPLPDTVRPACKCRRSALNAAEHWAQEGLIRLAHLDPDGAQELNGVGFNKIDGSVGHDLARLLATQGVLTDAQWRLAVKIATRYRRQIGPMPQEEGVTP